MTKKLIVLVGTLFAIGLLFPVNFVLADDGEDDEYDNDNENVVTVALSDFTYSEGWAVVPSTSVVDDDEITFQVENVSAFIPHDLIVIRTDQAADQLPRLGPGLGVDESKVDIVGRVPMLWAGEEATLNLELEEGNYVLVCNINPEGIKYAAHYEDGMYVSFTVDD